MPRPAPPRRLLLAEDDDDARVMLTRYLTGHGYAVTAVGDGRAALDALQADPSLDLVLLDVMMPHVNGFEVVEAARGKGLSVPIIMATAAAQPEDVVKALNLGADDYVTKPYAFPVLLARIQARMRERPPSPSAPPPPPRPQEGLMTRLRGLLKRPPTPPAEIQVGMTLAGRYRIEQWLGSGAFGTVYRGRHLDLDRPVAVKVLRAEDTAGGVEAFRKEAQSACRVRHRNAVHVFDFGVVPPDTAFLVMELLDGPTLDEVLRERRRLTANEALTNTRAVLSALSATHKQGVIHRDVKPANVVLHREDDGAAVPKLVDFGLARDDENAGGEDVLAGSPAYVSPERIRGEAYDGRADVYSCGIMLYKLLTGVLPIGGDLRDLDNIERWHLAGKAEPPSNLAPELPATVDAVVFKLLEKDPAKRPAADEAASLVDMVLWG